MNCRLALNAFHRWIIVNAEQENLAWSGSRWVPVDKHGFPAGDVQVSNFDSAEHAAATAKSQGLVVRSLLGAPTIEGLPKLGGPPQ